MGTTALTLSPLARLRGQRSFAHRRRGTSTPWEIDPDEPLEGAANSLMGPLLLPSSVRTIATMEVPAIPPQAAPHSPQSSAPVGPLYELLCAQDPPPPLVHGGSPGL